MLYNLCKKGCIKYGRVFVFVKFCKSVVKFCIGCKVMDNCVEFCIVIYSFVKVCRVVVEFVFANCVRAV